MLNNAAVKAARPRARPYKISDGGGLHLYVAPTGLRSWRLRYRRAGKEQLLVLGCWPDLTLDQARIARDQARAVLAVGEDPRRAAGPSVQPFEAVARAWFDARRDRWTAVHAADVIGSIELHVLPVIGDRPISAIGAADLLELLSTIEDAGAAATARRVRQRMEAIFKFARSRGWVDANPAELVAGELTPLEAAQHHPAVTTIEDARAVLAAIEAASARPIVKLAVRLLALTAVRVGALRGATLTEFEDLDGPAPVWRVPAARMKLRRADKLDSKNDYLVPLSPAAAAAVIAARAISRGEVLFAIGERAIGAMHERAGLGGRHVEHGWRATFSTILNEVLPDERDAIDAALAHRTKGKVEAAYNRALQIDRRRRLFDRWAEMLVG